MDLKLIVRYDKKKREKNKQSIREWVNEGVSIELEESINKELYSQYRTG